MLLSCCGRVGRAGRVSRVSRIVVVVLFVSCLYCRFVKISRIFVIAVRTAFSCLCRFSSSLFCSQLNWFVCHLLCEFNSHTRV